MRLCLDSFLALRREDWRVLVAIELGMRTHEYVPVPAIERTAHLKRGNAFKSIQLLLRHKLISHVNKKYDGYKVEFRGYDYLALQTFLKAGLELRVESRIGVGKESDVYLMRTRDDKLLVLKLARLGRTSFTRVKDTRDYIEHRRQYNWLYLSRLAAQREFHHLTALHQRGFPVPVPVHANRHAILMSFVNGFPFYSVKAVTNVHVLYNQIVDLLERFAMHGLVHGDFNEFNLILDAQQRVFVIDFPQIVSVTHPDAPRLFQRDLDCVNEFFARKFGFITTRAVSFTAIEVVERVDREIGASGVQKENQILLSYFHQPEGEPEEEAGSASALSEEESNVNSLGRGRGTEEVGRGPAAPAHRRKLSKVVEDSQRR